MENALSKDKDPENPDNKDSGNFVNKDLDKPDVNDPGNPDGNDRKNPDGNEAYNYADIVPENPDVNGPKNPENRVDNDYKNPENNDLGKPGVNEPSNPDGNAPNPDGNEANNSNDTGPGNFDGNEPGNPDNVISDRLIDTHLGNPDVISPERPTDKDEVENAGDTDGDSNAREKWGSKWEFMLTSIGFCVGIGNVWRFPYLAYANGGGAFLVAYIVMLVLVGKPLFLAELAIGQFAGLGSVQVWRCFPLGKGIGVAMIISSAVVGIYYNVIMCYCIYYVGQSFRSEVPWSDCYEWWGANKDCYLRTSDSLRCWEINETLAKNYSVPTNVVNYSKGSLNLTWENQVVVVPKDVYEKAVNSCTNGTQTASEQFWEIYVLQLSSGIDNLGTLKWDLVITLFICWLICALGLMKGIKSSGKIVYFTATFPYVILITLLIYGLTLEGATEGLKYFFIPDWSKLLDVQIWRSAAEQLLFSLGVGWGCLITFASYNTFENPLYKDAVFISFLDFATSLVSGSVIFSVLGNLSVKMHIDISKVAKESHGLTFVTYPEALARLPVPQLWSVMFFFMLFLLAVDSEFAYLENILTAIHDEYPKLKTKKTLITFSLCTCLFLLGLPCVTQGGLYVLNLMDTYGAGYSGLLVATSEIIAIMWGYGSERFSDDIHFMLGIRPGLYWRICWRFISPPVLMFLIIYSYINHKRISYNGVPYPMWAEITGFCVILVSILQIPIWMVVQLYKHRKNPRRVLIPQPEWGPYDFETRLWYRRYLSEDSLQPSTEDESDKKESV